MRRQFTPAQKAAVAMAALRGDKTINQVASEYEVNPTQARISHLNEIQGDREARTETYPVYVEGGL